MRKSVSSMESNFSALKKIDEFLSRRVNGYINNTKQFDTYHQYSEFHGNAFPVTEKQRISDAIKMYKSIVEFEREYGHAPEIDLLASKTWQEQMEAKRMLAANGMAMEVFADIDDGQIMIHNKVSNTHSVVDFKFAFDKENKYGHIQLSEEGKAIFPRLDSALRGITLLNGGHPVSLNRGDLMDHLKVDTSWMMSELVGLEASNDIIREISVSTGPMTLESRSHNKEQEFGESSIDMSR